MKTICLCILTLCFLSCKKSKQGTDPRAGKKGAEPTYEILKISRASAASTNRELVKLTQEFIFAPGTSKESLKINAVNFYRKYWENMQPIFAENERHKETIPNLLKEFEGKVSIAHFEDSFAIVQRPEHGISELDDITDVEDLWIFSADKWQPFVHFSNRFYKAQVIDLNGDGKKDVVLAGGCCDTGTMNIFISDINGIPNLTQDIGIIGRGDVSIKENCSSRIWIQHFQDDQNTKTAVFDCKTDLFVLK